MSHVGLDDEAIVRFVRALGQKEQERVLRGIVAHREADHWKGVLTNASCGWFRAYQELARRADPARYLDSCKAAIASDWTQALPLMAELTKGRRYEEAGAIAEEASRSMLHFRGEERWDPRAVLVVQWAGYRENGGPDEDAKRFLREWAWIAKALGKEDLACALELQRLVWERWAEGDEVLAAFRRIPATQEGVRSRLFAAWRKAIEDESVARPDTVPYGDGRKGSAAWIHTALDAALAPPGEHAAFVRFLRDWISGMRTDAKAFRDDTAGLVALTADLDDGTIRRASPALARLAARSSRGPPKLRAFRRRLLQRLGARQLLPELVELWGRNAPLIVPDPSSVFGGSYGPCAEVLAVVRELDPVAYRRIVAEWQKLHQRRRKLWVEMSRRHLPVS